MSPGGDPALEIDVVAEDPDELVDGLARQLVLERRLVEALVEPDAGRAVVVLLLVLVASPATCGSGLVVRRRHGDEQAAIVGGRDALDAALAEQDRRGRPGGRRPGAAPAR